MCVVNDIMREIGKANPTLPRLLNFSNALSYIGLRPTTVKLLHNYPVGETQGVCIDSHISSYVLAHKIWHPVRINVGPLLYTIHPYNFVKYINKCKLHFYTENTQLYYSFLIQEIQGIC